MYIVLELCDVILFMSRVPSILKGKVAPSVVKKSTLMGFMSGFCFL